MTEKDLLVAGLENVRKYGFKAGQYRDPGTGCVCVLGALYMPFMLPGESSPSMPGSQKNLHLALRAREIFKKVNNIKDIIGWSDTGYWESGHKIYTRTQVEVETAFEKAIEACDVT